MQGRRKTPQNQLTPVKISFKPLEINNNSPDGVNLLRNHGTDEENSPTPDRSPNKGSTTEKSMLIGSPNRLKLSSISPEPQTPIQEAEYSTIKKNKLKGKIASLLFLQKLVTKKEVEIPMAKKEEKSKTKSRSLKDLHLLDYITNLNTGVQKAIFKRKRIRFLFCAFYLGIVAAGIILSCIFAMKQDRVILDETKDLSLSLDNCTLYILDHVNPEVPSSIYADYELPRNLSRSEIKNVIVDTAGSHQSIKINNEYGSRYCLLKLFMKPSVKLNNLEIICHDCNIIQRTSFQLQVESILVVEGNEIHANFMDLKVGILLFYAPVGHFQLNNVITTIGGENLIYLAEGDVILQSISDFTVYTSLHNDAYCLYGPTVTQVQNDTCIEVETESDLMANSSCSAAYDICKTSSCSASRSTFLTTVKVGNLYANLIPGIEEIVASDSEYVISDIYNDGIDFSPAVNATLNEFNSAVSDTSKNTPFLILDIGDQRAQSSRFSRWVAASSRPYALLRPWWFGTLSATVLDPDTTKISGFLLPGFCPYRPQVTSSDLYEIQNLIYSKISADTEFVAMIDRHRLTERPDQNAADETLGGSGIFEYVHSTVASEEWLSFMNQTEGTIATINSTYNEQPLALVTVILSVVVALFIAFLGFELTKSAIIFLYKKLLNFSEHIKNYSDLAKNAENPANDSSIKLKRNTSWYSLGDFLGRVPSLSEFVDYLVFILTGQFSNSTKRFYELLFKKNDRDDEADLSKEVIKFSEVKILYEQFCFLNYFTEKRLNDPKNLAVLTRYNYEIINRDDKRTDVFTGINIKNYKTFAVDRQEGEGELDSLALYHNNFEKTSFTEDQVEVELFIRLYRDFCNYNKLDYIEITSALMEERYRISTVQVPEQYLARRRRNTQGIHDEDDDDVGFLHLNKKLFFWRSRKQQNYIIDTVKLENHMKFLMNDIQNLTEDEVKEATLDLIWYQGVWAWDALVVFLHLVLIAALTVPLIMFVILNQAEYTPWSVKDPSTLIYWKDLTQDPGRLFSNIFLQSFPWNSIIIAFVIGFFFLKVLGLFSYYVAMTFPVNRLLQEDKKKSSFMTFLKLFEWLSFTIVLLAYFIYIGIFLMWLLLGAFICPNVFLPFASAAATFGTFVVSKYKSFKGIYVKGKDVILIYLTKIFADFVNSVANRIMAEVKGINGSVFDETNNFLQSGQVKAVKGKILDSGLVDPKIIEEFEKKVKEMNVQNALEIALDPSIIAQGFKDLKSDLEKAMVNIICKS